MLFLRVGFLPAPKFNCWKVQDWFRDEKTYTTGNRYWVAIRLLQRSADSISQSTRNLRDDDGRHIIPSSVCDEGRTFWFHMIKVFNFNHIRCLLRWQESFCLISWSLIASLMHICRGLNWANLFFISSSVLHISLDLFHLLISRLILASCIHF